MALSTTREFGVRHVVNATAPNPEQESSGMRSDWAGELYATVASYAALPASGNWPGRRRWVTDLGIEFRWSGEWEAVGGNLPHMYVQGLSSTPTLGATAQDIWFDTSGVVASHPGMLDGAGGFFAPIAGRYELVTSVGVNPSGSTEFRLCTRKQSNTSPIIHNVETVVSRELHMHAVIELTMGEWCKHVIVRNSSTGNTATYSTGSNAIFRYLGPVS